MIALFWNKSCFRVFNKCFYFEACLCVYMCVSVLGGTWKFHGDFSLDLDLLPVTHKGACATIFFH